MERLPCTGTELESAEILRLSPLLQRAVSGARGGEKVLGNTVGSGYRETLDQWFSTGGNSASQRTLSNV